MKRTTVAVLLAVAVSLAAPSTWAQNSAGAQDQAGQKTQKTKVIKDKKKDPDAIGERDVGKGLNWYSIEKEIAMGKSYALAGCRWSARRLGRPTISC